MRKYALSRGIRSLIRPSEALRAFPFTRDGEGSADLLAKASGYCLPAYTHAIRAAAAITCLALLAGCSKPPPVTVAVDLICTETSRYHSTDAQRAAVKADPSTWYTLFQWLASFDAVRDKRCPQ